MARLVLVLITTAALIVPAAAIAKPGKLDPRYGSNGFFETKALDGGFAGRLEPGGGLLVAGGIYEPGVARLTARGNRVRRFGDQGVARTRTTPGFGGIPFDVRRMPDGTIRTGALTVASGGPVMAFLRYGSRGERMAHHIHEPYMPGPMIGGAMTRFGDGYVASQGGLYGERSGTEIRAIAPDGQTRAAFGFGGTFKPQWMGLTGVGEMIARRGGVLFSSYRNNKPVLAQLSKDGTPDRTFGDDGVVRLPFRAALIHVARGGDLVVVGAPGRFLARVVKYSAQGSRRRSFGIRGIAGWHRTRYGGPADVATDARGRIYVLVNHNTGERGTIGVLAFTGAGQRLNRFGRRSLARLPRPRQEFAAHEAADLVVDRGGLLVVSSHHIGGLYHMAFGSGDREDISAYDTRLRVWRLDR